MIHKITTIVLAAIAASLLLISPMAFAHGGEDDEAIAKPLDVSIAPRFEVHGDAVELVGVLVDKNLVIYLDRIDSNAPIENAQIEIEGSGIKGTATDMSDGVYQLPAAALSKPGKFPLTITLEAGEISDLLSGNLEVGAAAEAVVPATQASNKWWFAAGIGLLLVASGFIAPRLRRQQKKLGNR